MIAVTGAAGFIGSNLAHRLAGMGHDLLLCDHPPADPIKAANLAGLTRFPRLDPDEFVAHLQRHCPTLDGLFHLGACSSTTETDWDFLRRNNVEYSQSLWNWCAANGCPFVYASSAATYGDGTNGFDDRTPPESLTPLNLYGKSKNDFDAWALAEVAIGHPAPPTWAGLKFFNVYGPRELHKGGMASVVRHAYRQIVDTGEMKLFRSTDPAYPDGGQRRDFVFVGDCIDHMLWLWQRPGGAGIYNSGTGTARTFLDLVNAVFAALSREPVVRFIDMPASLAKQYQNFTQAEMSKLRHVGCEHTPTTLEDGVRQTVAWLQQQANGAT